MPVNASRSRQVPGAISDGNVMRQRSAASSTIGVPRRDSPRAFVSVASPKARSTALRTTSAVGAGTSSVTVSSPVKVNVARSGSRRRS